MEKNNNVSQKTRKLTVLAVMTALVFVVTWLVKIPVGVGYLNFGDVVIYMCAYILGGPLTAVAAAVGSSLADIAAGYAIYAIPTLVIKALMGLVAGLIMKRNGAGFYLLGSVTAGAIMVAGYAAFEYVSYGSAQMVANLPFNFIQLGGSVGIALMFYRVTLNISKYFGFRERDIV